MDELPQKLNLPSGFYRLLSASKEMVQFQQIYPDWWRYHTVNSCRRELWAAGNPFNHPQ